MGSFPIFYIIPVSSELADATREKRQPTHETTVYTYTPQIELEHWSGGLWHMENRLPILRVYEALKDFIPANASHTPEAWLPYISEEA